MTKRELEGALENRCVARIEALGGLALKLSIPGVRGFPDRTVLAPGKLLSNGHDRHSPDSYAPPRVWFFETKRLKTGKISAQQHKWRVRRGAGGVEMKEPKPPKPLRDLDVNYANRQRVERDWNDRYNDYLNSRKEWENKRYPHQINNGPWGDGE